MDRLTIAVLSVGMIVLVTLGALFYLGEQVETRLGGPTDPGFYQQLRQGEP